MCKYHHVEPPERNAVLRVNVRVIINFFTNMANGLCSTKFSLFGIRRTNCSTSTFSTLHEVEVILLELAKLNEFVFVDVHEGQPLVNEMLDLQLTNIEIQITKLGSTTSIN